MNRKIPQWIVIDFQTSEAVCQRCGGRERAPLPAPISSFVKWCEYFGDRHKRCTENAPLHLQGGAAAEHCKCESGCSQEDQ